MCSCQESVCDRAAAVSEAEYSSFLTIPEAPISPWSSVSGCTPVTEQSGLKGCDLSAYLSGEFVSFKIEVIHSSVCFLSYLLKKHRVGN